MYFVFLKRVNSFFLTFLLVSLEMGCKKQEPLVYNLPEIQILSPEKSELDLKVGTQVEISLRLNAESGLFQLYADGSSIKTWSGNIKSDEAKYNYITGSSSEILEFTIIDNAGERTSTILSINAQEFPTVKVIYTQNIGPNIRPEVGEQFAIKFDVSAEAGLSKFLLNEKVIKSWDIPLTNDEVTYSITPLNLEPIDLVFTLEDLIGDQSEHNIIHLNPKVTSLVKFSVDMTGIAVSNGVYIGGSFTSVPIAMEEDGNGIYTHEAEMLSGDSGDYYFLNGLTLLDGWFYTEREEIPVRCGDSNTNIARNRSFEVGNEDVIFNSIWGKCNDSVDNERILFFGNSITALGNHENGYIPLLDKKLNKAGIIKDLIGVGISGQRVVDLKERVQRDVIDAFPTTVVIYIGINDVWFGETTAEQFSSEYNDMIKSIKSTNANIILVTPAVIGELKNGMNILDRQLDEFAEIVRKLAEEHNLNLVDMRSIFIDYLENNNPNNVPQGLLTTDGVHMTNLGNQLIADSLIDYLIN